ncbi:MAG: bifunctional N(6)-L-threonylcarbamoyladenine synthase/serine/threonine protein kinase [Nanoarchaeota archaeon]|nr:bifunctional N(6)-L-threonylcarbamoyladenine synthase/serine/threonine protein kinase [Nanoarchaeota archaeon]
MVCLGIETTAHTFGVSIAVEENGQGKILSNVRDSYTTKKGGMIPNQAADHHVDVCDVVLKKSLDEAKIKIDDVDVICFSQGPGIGHTLRIGAFFARCLAHMFGKPLVGVNHCIAHLEIARLVTDATDPVLLYVSGANTQVIAYEGQKYRIFGETLDIGIGNFLDCFARELDLGFPGGPHVYELSLKSKKYIELPYVVKGMDVSFGGLLTNLKQKIHKSAFGKEYTKEDLCFSAQETTFAMLVEVAERALNHCDKRELVLGGGVACNKRLQEMCHKMCKDAGFKFYVPEPQYLIDNAAMIAWLGLLEFKVGNILNVEDSKDSKMLPYWRTDDVIVNWR